jgi:hypothetical protein
MRLFLRHHRWRDARVRGKQEIAVGMAFGRAQLADGEAQLADPDLVPSGRNELA